MFLSGPALHALCRQALELCGPGEVPQRSSL